MEDRWNGTNRRMVGSYLTTCLYLSCYLKLKIAYFFMFLGLISEYTQIRKGVRPAETDPSTVKDENLSDNKSYDVSYFPLIFFFNFCHHRLNYINGLVLVH